MLSSVCWTVHAPNCWKKLVFCYLSLCLRSVLFSRPKPDRCLLLHCLTKLTQKKQLFLNQQLPLYRCCCLCPLCLQQLTVSSCWKQLLPTNRLLSDFLYRNFSPLPLLTTLFFSQLFSADLYSSWKLDQFFPDPTISRLPNWLLAESSIATRLCAKSPSTTTPITARCFPNYLKLCKGRQPQPKSCAQFVQKAHSLLLAFLRRRHLSRRFSKETLA